MSSREPMWYCHECHAEMRPLMVPDPHCASCNGSFVEKIENPADDPREFGIADGGHWDDGPLPAEMDVFLNGLRSILGGGPPVAPTAPTPPTPPSSDPTSPNGNTTTTRSYGRNGQFTIRIERSNTPGGRTRTVVMGGPPRAGGSVGAGTPGQPPRLSQFVPRSADSPPEDRANITGPLLTQYLLALMGNGVGGNRNGAPFADLFGGMFPPGGMPGGGENGRWGDYVFNQEALDQIITQIMESNNAHQPVPATEDVVAKLPREVLEHDSPLLEKDCAVCKEQFKLETEDPDEQVVITLPCKHPFHEPCILPWLKTSGTCPVCRYQLVPQPDSSAPGPGPPSAGSSRSNSSTEQSNNTGGGIFQNVFNLFSQTSQSQSDQSSSSSGGSGSNQRRNSTPTTSAAQPSPTRPRTQDDFDIPGGWGDELD